MSVLRLALPFLSILLLTGCLTDAATRLAYDIKTGAARVGSAAGADYVIEHRTPSRRGQCAGPYTVQLDQVGALIIWCRDEGGEEVVSSHGTSYHRRFVDTPRTWILEKSAGETLVIRLERRNGRILIAEAL